MAVITLVDRIDALLPQTQCGQCSHAGCRPYAEALAQGRDPINRCPPGGEDGIRALAELLGQPAIPFDPAGPQPKPRALAVIREDSCIGCTLCIQACPVDAIVGAAKQMHTVIADECTGCELCLAPCPVDCIDLVPVADPDDGKRERVMARAAQARKRFDARQARKDRDAADKARRLAADKNELIRKAMERAKQQAPVAATASADKMAVIRAAMERAAAMKAAQKEADKDKE
ncbi:electron transport complex subunit RsxB [Chromobacterium violaceum]|uniref:Nitrogen fixation protein rnfB n=1 Tax=Chromobacterium violaceum TaxID=536 RepID=A0AAX2M670_CHRVL|nr:electron transport complex subunit RsxB [Chromobacterium violaceum]OLZ83783.1 ferredoxin [Chromobacterium violaceum]STB71957.1 Nitrogen fixation protein rnfB [Chromobacterium violaceum]SUX31573.1 Nitrogen fixation protein rnfB [Chromobacterium violaceum]